MPDCCVPRQNRKLRGLARRQRIKHAALFAEARIQRERYPGRLMVLCLRRAPDACMRLGVIASRNIGNAVARNRAKRRLREVFRINRPRLRPVECDVILLARVGIIRADWLKVREEFLALATRAGLWKADEKST